MSHDVSAELESLRREVAELRTRLDADGSASGVSRRHLLRAAPAAALGGAIALIAGAAPASAAAGDPVLQGENNGFSGTTTLDGGSADGPALDVTGSGLIDRLAIGPFPLGGGVGPLLAVTPHPDAEADELPSGPVMYVAGFQRSGPDRHMGSTALAIDTVGPGPAMTLNAADGYNDPDGPDGPRVPYPGTGLQVTAGGTAIDVQVGGPDSDLDAVTVEYAGTSRAFFAVSSSPTNINGTVTGVNEGHGIGVWGEQRNDSVSGYGVVGVAGKLGRGGSFQGGAAALRLVPGTSGTHRSTGKVGDVYVDSTARLWFCTKASTSTVSATWRQIAFV